MKMLKLSLISMLVLCASCATPVLKKEILTQAEVADPAKIKAAPEASKARLFILGGLIVTVRNEQSGSMIEAVFIRADEKGHLKEREYGPRFLARTADFIDPVIYKAGRKITIAGEFSGFEKGKIGDMEYDYPVFLIKDIYLWPEEKIYEAPPWWYDPWYYWWYDPWWRYRYPYWY
ncbi:MAG: Slp family lipoprotein [Thermodesulfovibrionales bacterium]|nr:Slp family lipoprotein [Thermodesulfovibrionales bacterium]